MKPSKLTMIKFLIGIGAMATLLLIGELLSALTMERQLEAYYGTSFLTALILIVFCSVGFLAIKKMRNLVFFSMNVPIAVCYIGFVVEIFKTGLGPALLFGLFNAEVSGILFNYSTVLSMISVGYFALSAIKLVKFKL